jgi:hypothetical protein
MNLFICSPKNKKKEKRKNNCLPRVVFFSTLVLYIQKSHMTFSNENPKFVGFVVYKQGDNGTLFYIIFTGSVKVFQVCLFFFLF